MMISMKNLAGALALCTLLACGASKPATTTPTATAQAKTAGSMQIKLTSVYVDDQEKALRFYTDVLGFVKKDDFTNGPYRWLTVASPEEPDGTELQLALNDNPAAKAYQQAMFQQGQPAAMFYHRRRRRPTTSA